LKWGFLHPVRLSPRGAVGKQRGRASPGLDWLCIVSYFAMQSAPPEDRLCNAFRFKGGNTLQVTQLRCKSTGSF
jgi:hypothetical protein